MEPVQSITILGFSINAGKMEINLPSHKVRDTIQEAQTLLAKKEATVRQLAHLIGTFSSTFSAILPAPLHYRGIQ